MSDWIYEMNPHLLRHLIGYDTRKHLRYAMIDALSDECCSWSVHDVQVMAEECDEQWGMNLREYCDEVKNVWRELNE